MLCCPSSHPCRCPAQAVADSMRFLVLLVALTFASAAASMRGGQQQVLAAKARAEECKEYTNAGCVKCTRSVSDSGFGVRCSWCYTSTGDKKCTSHPDSYHGAFSYIPLLRKTPRCLPADQGGEGDKSWTIVKSKLECPEMVNAMKTTQEVDAMNIDTVLLSVTMGDGYGDTVQASLAGDDAGAAGGRAGGHERDGRCLTNGRGGHCRDGRLLLVHPHPHPLRPSCVLPVCVGSFFRVAGLPDRVGRGDVQR